jgi:hypothetical protein
MTREEIVKGLKAGRVLHIDRMDSPALPIVVELEREGKVTTQLVQHDEQSSSLRVVWSKGKPSRNAG